MQQLTKDFIEYKANRSELLFNSIKIKIDKSFVIKLNRLKIPKTEHNELIQDVWYNFIVSMDHYDPKRSELITYLNVALHNIIKKYFKTRSTNLHKFVDIDRIIFA